MESYCPESPRVLSSTAFLRPGMFGKKKAVVPTGKVPDYLKNMLNFRDTNIKKNFTPIYRWEAYIKDLERIGGTDEDIIERIRSDHEAWERDNPKEPPSTTKEVMDVPNRADATVVNMKVSKTGKVKVTIEAPLEAMYTKYYSKGVKAPMVEYIKALKKFGYPESVLIKVLEKAQQRESKGKEMDAFIERIFGKGGGKTSKPKAKSVVNQLSSMLKIRK